MIKTTLVGALLLAIAGTASGQTAGSTAQSQTRSDAGAMAATGAITFEASDIPDSQRVHTTPSVYNAPSMFGYSQNNCGASDTMAVSVTGFGFGGSKAGESIRCNTRQDVATAWNLGLQQVAVLRFACFGEPENRMAYEAAGYACPSSGTAKGIEGAPVGPKFLVASANVQATMHYRIQQDGSVSEVR